MAVAQQPRQATQTRQEAPLSSADMEKVLLKTEEELAAMRAKIEDSLPGLQRAIATSTALQRMRDIVTVPFVTRYVYPLMNSPLGFLTDKVGKGGQSDFYKPEELIEPTIECLMRGFNLAGNEWNVIAGKFYGAQNGYVRLFKESPGVTEPKGIPGEPVQNGGQATVRYAVMCKLNGKDWFLTNEKGEPGRKFTIRVNSGMGLDAIIGKAKKKAFQAAYEEVSGKLSSESEDVDTGERLPPEIPAGRSKIPNGNGKSAAPAESPQIDIAGGEVQNDPPAPPADFDEAGAKQWFMNLSDAVHQVVDMKAMYKLGSEIEERRALLGEQYYAELTGLRQAKSAELLAAKK